MSDKVEIRTLNGHALADTKAREALENKQPKGDYATRDEIPSVPVQSVNNKTGAVQLTAADVGAADAKETAQALDALSGEIAQQPTSKPRVYIDGVIPTTKDDVFAELTYECGAERWHAYVEIKCQGSSSMQFPKKNFTVKLYSDETRTVKLKKKMFGWPVASNKYVLKANYIDHSHARNVVTANLWSEVVASRPDYDTLPAELRNSPNNGAIDGYPVIVYTNGNYQGLYTWNIGKDDWMWGMDEDNPKHVLMCAETNTDFSFTETPCNFRALWSGINEDNWSVEVGTNSDSVKNSLNALISCVKDTDDATFKATIDNYLDVQSAIDYYLIACADCGIDGLGKNLLLGTYDLKKWYCGAYDLDSTWLLYFMGTKFLPAKKACPGSYQEKYSLLWERIAKAYKAEMYARGKTLRKTVLSYSNIMSHFEKFCASIGSEAYADDLVPYPNIPSANTNNIWQLRNAVRDRLEYFDNWLDVMYTSNAVYEIPETKIETGSDVIGTTASVIGYLTPFTYAIDMTPKNAIDLSAEAHVFYEIDSASQYYEGLCLFKNKDGEYYKILAKNYEYVHFETIIPRTTTDRCVVIIRRAENEHKYKVYCKVGESVQDDVLNIYHYDFCPYTNARLYIGWGASTDYDGNPITPWFGTIHRFVADNRCWTDEEVAAFAAGMNS